MALNNAIIYSISKIQLQCFKSVDIYLLYNFSYYIRNQFSFYTSNFLPLKKNL